MSRSFKFVPPSATDRLLGRPPVSIQTDISTAQGRTEVEVQQIQKLRDSQKKVLEKYEEVKKYLGVDEQTPIKLVISPAFQLEYTNTTRSTYAMILSTLRNKDGFSSLAESVSEMEKIHRNFNTLFSAQGSAGSDSEQQSGGGGGVPSTPGTVKQNKVLPASRQGSLQPKTLFNDDYEEEEEDDLPIVPDSNTRPVPAPPLTTASSSTVPAVVAATPPPPVPPAQPVKQLARAINNVLQRALVPLLDSIGALAFALGEQDVRSFMVYDERQKGSRRDLPTDRLRVIDEDDPKLTTVAYLMERYEPILGNAFLSIYLEQALVSLTNQGNQLLEESKQKLINACFDFDRDLLFEPPFLNSAQTLEALKKLPEPHSEKIKAKIAELETAQEAAGMVRRTDPESRFAPGWAFSVLGNSVFRAIASPPVLAAFEMAANQVRSFPGCSSFTLKELLCSSATMNQFVFLAARHYMRDISVLAAAAGSSRGGRKRQGGNYINVNQARKELQERAFLISIWFERVYAVPNPLLAQFDTYRRALKHTETLSGGLEVSMPLDPAFEARMQQYRDALPQRELRHKE